MATTQPIGQPAGATPAERTPVGAAPAQHALAAARAVPGRDRLLTILLAAAAIGAVLQITMGGVVRVTGSGLGCPDWPLCQGSIVPVFRDYHTALEWSHRLTGTLVGLTLAAATARAWFAKPRDGTVLRAVAATLALIAVVGAMGGAVVLTELSPGLRTFHLALAEGVVLLAAFAWAASAYQPRQGVDAARSREFRLAAVAGVSVLAALLSGSYAVWRGAGAACPSWPLCGGPVVPENALTWIHVAHRLLAAASVVLVLWAAHRAYRTKDGPRALKWAALGALALVTAQALIGAANPWSGFDQWARALHLSVGSLLWLDLAVVAVLVLRPVPRAGKTGAPPGALREPFDRLRTTPQDGAGVAQ